MNRKANDGQVRELLLQALETERGGIQVYTAALKAVQNKDLKQEWEYEVLSDVGKDLKARLNELGAEGWILTSTEPAFIFRRPKKPEPERFRGPVGFSR